MTQGLAGLQVLEMGGGIAAAMAGKVLADLGATVVKVEPPGGEALRFAEPSADGALQSGLSLHLNANKRSVEFDLAAGADRSAFDALVARSDLLIEDQTPRAAEALGLAAPALHEINSQLVILSMTGFGQIGPHHDFAWSDLSLIHAGGWGWIIPGKGTPKERPPIKPFGSHVYVQAGLHGATVALGACLHARATGEGDHIDLSMQETVMFILGRHIAMYPYTGDVDHRSRPALFEPMGFYLCEDGYLFIICPEQAQWERMLALMGDPPWAASDEFRTRDGRMANGPAIRTHVEAWTKTWRVEALFHELQQKRVGAAPVFTYPQLSEQPQLKARDFFSDLESPGIGSLSHLGAPYRLKRRWWNLRAPAPALGDAQSAGETVFAPTPSPISPTTNSERAPLAGVRVLDLSWVWAGPHCTMILGALGAEVLKIESTRRIDLTRRSALYASGQEPSPDRNAYFNQINQFKKSVGINLSAPEGIAIVKQLASECDVMVSNFGTGVLERLGLGPEQMHEVNPKLTIAMISAFGQDGPLNTYTGYGPLISPLGGISAQTGYADDDLPRDLNMAYGDPNGGIYAAFGIMSALFARQQHHEAGQVIDISMWEAMLCTGFEGWANYMLGGAPYGRAGNGHPHHAPHNVYRCAGDDSWVAISVEKLSSWRGLCEVIGRSDWGADPSFSTPAGRKGREQQIDEAIASWTKQRDCWEITAALQSNGVPSYPSLDAAALYASEHLAARGVLCERDHPSAGVRKMMDIPWRHGRKYQRNTDPAPLLGQHTDATLAALLGLSGSELAALRDNEVIE